MPCYRRLMARPRKEKKPMLPTEVQRFFQETGRRAAKSAGSSAGRASVQRIERHTPSGQWPHGKQSAGRGHEPGRVVKRGALPFAPRGSHGVACHLLLNSHPHAVARWLTRTANGEEKLV